MLPDAPKYRLITKPASTTVTGENVPRRADSHNTAANAAAAPANATAAVPYTASAGANTAVSVRAVCAPPLTASVLSEASGLCRVCCISIVANAEAAPAKNAMAIRGRVLLRTANASSGRLSDAAVQSVAADGHCTAKIHMQPAAHTTASTTANRTNGCFNRIFTTPFPPAQAVFPPTAAQNAP